MGYSFRIRLPGGRLKIKTQDRLRRREFVLEGYKTHVLLPDEVAGGVIRP